MLLPLREAINASKHHLELFLFDFDGVILESVAARDQAFWELFNDYPDEIRDQILSLHQKNPGIDRKIKILRCYEEILDFTPEADELMERVRRFGILAIQKVMSCPVVPGILKFLTDLDPERCFVVSAARQDEILKIVNKRQLSRYFSGVFGGPDKKAKLISKIIASEKVGVKNIVFVGDKKSDWYAAEKTGIQFYGRICSGSGNPFPDSVQVFRDYN